MKDLTEKAVKFREDRDWTNRFDNVKDMILSLTSEVGEFADIYRWLSQEQMDSLLNDPEKKEIIKDELGDIIFNVLLLCDMQDIDPRQAFEDKLAKLEKKYPADKVKGKVTSKHLDSDPNAYVASDQT